MRPHPATCLARSHALCGCLAAVTAIAQLSMGISTVEAQERPTFEWVSRDEGLVHPTVTAVYQDQIGRAHV